MKKAKKAADRKAKKEKKRKSKENSLNKNEEKVVLNDNSVESSCPLAENAEFSDYDSEGELDYGQSQDQVETELEKILTPASFDSLFARQLAATETSSPSLKTSSNVSKNKSVRSSSLKRNDRSPINVENVKRHHSISGIKITQSRLPFAVGKTKTSH